MNDNDAKNDGKDEEKNDDKKARALSRRNVLGAAIAATAGGTAMLGVDASSARKIGAGKTGENSGASQTSDRAAARQPVIFVPHGGGPWPFVEMSGFISRHDVEIMRAYFVDLPTRLPEPPKALLVVSAHWEAAVPTVMTASRPPIYYDYGGFPAEAYTIEWPAPGNPALAERVVKLLNGAGISTATDPRRGFDHGTFIPFKLSWPQADVPTIQLSLKAGLDPAEHLAIGRALAPLRDEGVLILGSGMSYHNLRDLRTESAQQVSRLFDGWLKETVTADPSTRARRLADWTSAPGARQAHPREEHLLPLMVVAGAAGKDPGRITFNEDWMRVRISAVEYG